MLNKTFKPFLKFFFLIYRSFGRMVNGGNKLFGELKTCTGCKSLRSLGTPRDLVLTRAVDRRRMDRSVRAEVKVVSLLTLASFLIST